MHVSSRQGARVCGCSLSFLRTRTTQDTLLAGAAFFVARIVKRGMWSSA